MSGVGVEGLRWGGRPSGALPWRVHSDAGRHGAPLVTSWRGWAVRRSPSVVPATRRASRAVPRWWAITARRTRLRRAAGSPHCSVGYGMPCGAVMSV